ncbi:MAG: ABC transporter ATP-binding protein [Anaerolineaceae bacterium]
MYLTLQNVSKVFPPRGGVVEVTAVNNISLDIERGDLVTLLGPSGCGKTTTLRMIAGFDFPTSGKIWLDGAEIDPLPPNKRGMSMVFQSYAIFPHLNVFENIAYGLNVRRLPQSKIIKQVDRVLDLVHLTGYEKRAPNQLSGGQQQRVALARALVMEPKVLLMDEPLSNLDAKLRDQMRTEIRRIQKTLGITSVYVTHDQIEAMTLSDKVVVMNQGVIEQIGTPMEVYRYPSSPFVADFIGRANFAKGVVQAIRNGVLEITTLGETVKLSNCRGEFKPKDRVALIIRPEMVTIRKSGGLFKGVIRRAVYLGNIIEYDVEVSGFLITGTETDPSRQELFPEGTDVTVDLAKDCIQILHD